MKRIYEENGIRAKGNIVPLSRFRPFLDFGELTPDEKYLDELVKIAEGMLDEEIPCSLSHFTAHISRRETVRNSIKNI